MIFTRNNIKKTPIVPLVNLSSASNVKNQTLRTPQVRFGYNMFDAVAKFSNCDSCNKMK